MRTRRAHIAVYAAIASMLLPVVSCNTTGCLENRSSIPLAGFYSSATHTAISIDSLTITGIGKTDGKPLNDPGKPTNSVYLPMRSTQQSTAWELSCRVHYKAEDDVTYAFTIADTLSFDYDSQPYFASDECGVIYRYQITHMSYTRHLIDSVAITDSLISNTDIERIQIYYRTQE